MDHLLGKAPHNDACIPCAPLRPDRRCAREIASLAMFCTLLSSGTALAVPGYEVTPWYGILLPAGAHPALVERINKDIAAVLKDRSLEERIIADGGSVAAGSPGSFRKLILNDMAKWKQLAKSANLKLD